MREATASRRERSPPLPRRSCLLAERSFRRWNRSLRSSKPLDSATDPLDSGPDPLEAPPDPLETGPDPLEVPPDPLKIGPNPLEIALDPRVPGRASEENAGAQGLLGGRSVTAVSANLEYHAGQLQRFCRPEGLGRCDDETHGERTGA